MMSARLWFVLGCMNGLMAVGMGAYGAHGFDGKLDYLADSFNVGVQYQMWHTIALLAVAWAYGQFQHRIILVAGVAFLIGIVLFAGTLYVFGITGTLPMAGLAPSGGLSLMVGWALLALGAWQGRKS